MRTLKFITIYVLLITFIFQGITVYLLFQKDNAKPLDAVYADSPNILSKDRSLTIPETTIGRGRLTFYPGEGYNNKFRNLEVALSRIDGIEIAPGQDFSFNKVTGLLNQDVDKWYYPGYNIVNDLVPAGGICSAGVLIATGVKNAGFQFKDLSGNYVDNPVAHRDYFYLYHRTLEIDGIQVPVVDATVATELQDNGDSRSLNDVIFTNTTSKRIVLRVAWEWGPKISDINYPFMRNDETVSMTVRINSMN
jgi:hypothetical protein